MEIYCSHEFKEEYDKLVRKNAYKQLPHLLIKLLFAESTDVSASLQTGKRLFNSKGDRVYIKKRLKGASGFRMYYLLLIIEDRVYLMFIHPKTGDRGSSNIKDDAIKDMAKRIYEAIKANKLFQLSTNNEKTDLIFTDL